MLTRLSARRRLAVLTATLAALLALGLQPALATEGGGVVVGGGTISPGLSLTPNSQSVAFGGTAVVVGAVNPTDAALANCNFSGGSTGTETVISGMGTASGVCTTADARSGTCNVRYYRVSGHVSISGTCSGYVTGNLGGIFNFVPTAAPTVTSYQLQGVVALSSTAPAGTPFDIVGGTVVPILP